MARREYRQLRLADALLGSRKECLSALTGCAKYTNSSHGTRLTLFWRRSTARTEELTAIHRYVDATIVEADAKRPRMSEGEAHLEKLGFNDLKVHPDPMQVATEGALWGTIAAEGHFGGTMVVSDGAGQFRLADHALCWVHAERLIHKLETFCDEHRHAKERVRGRIWWFYDDLKEYRQAPTARRARGLSRRFNRIFSTTTGSATLDRLLTRLLARKNELLAVLERPEIPLHTNGSAVMHSSA